MNSLMLGTLAEKLLHDGIFDATESRPYPLNQGVCVTMRDRIGVHETILDSEEGQRALTELRRVVRRIAELWIAEPAQKDQPINASYALWVDLQDPCPENAYSQLRVPSYWVIDADKTRGIALQKEPANQYDWFESYTKKDGTPIALGPNVKPFTKFELEFIKAYRAKRIAYLAFARRCIKELIA